MCKKPAKRLIVVGSFFICGLFLNYAIGEDVPFDPDTVNRQIVENVSHPNYCKDKFGNEISGSECIKKSVDEVKGKKHTTESETIAENIKESLKANNEPKVQLKENAEDKELPKKYKASEVKK